MKSIEEFEHLYETEFKSKLIPFEKERKKFILKCRLVLAVPLAFFLARFIALQFFHIETSMVIGNELYAFFNISCFVFSLVALIVFLIMRSRFKEYYVPKFKSEIVNEIVKFIDAGLNYDPYSGISYSSFVNSYIFLQRTDRCLVEDHVSGMIENTAIEFSEVRAQYETQSTNDKGETTSRWHTTFRGMFFEADFNKKFASRTVVLPDNFGKRLGFIGQKLQSVNFMRDDLIKLEDPEFEKYFVVYGTNQIEARYILSTSLMARIVDFRKKTGAKFCLSFIENKLFLAMPVSTNLFEPSIFSSILKFSLLSKYFNYFILFIGIVDDLNLNSRVWNKD